MTGPDSPAVRRARRCARNPAAFPSLPARFAADLLAELDEARRDVERLRGRTHEIQAQEMTKRAALDAEAAEWRLRWETAKRWTEDEGLLAEWAHGEFASSPFWGMTSMNARDSLMRLVAERDEARSTSAEWCCSSCGATTRARMADAPAPSPTPDSTTPQPEVGPVTTASAEDPPRQPVTEAQLRRAGRSALRIARAFSAVRFSSEVQELADLADWLLGDEGDPGSPWPLRASVEPRAAVAPPEAPSAAFAATEASEAGSSPYGHARGSYGAPQRQRSDPETAEAVCAAAEAPVRQSETVEGCEAAHGAVEGAEDPAARLRRAAIVAVTPTRPCLLRPALEGACDVRGGDGDAVGVAALRQIMATQRCAVSAPPGVDLDRLRAEHEFMLARAQAEAQAVYPRCWGLSSNALALYALGLGPRPRVPGTPKSRGYWVGEGCGVGEYPFDEDDLSACQLTYTMAPPHLQERMAPVLAEFRGWVLQRRNRHGEVVPK